MFSLRLPSSPAWFAVICLFCLCALSSISAQTAAKVLTPVTGFHSAAESDPFAKSGELQVTSAPAPITSLPGARATVTVGCYEATGLDSVRAALAGMRAGPSLGFKIAVSGANLDIVTQNSVHTTPNLFGPTTQYATQDRSVDVRMRFDQEKPIEDAPPATDTHHVEISYALPEHADEAQRLVIGLSANGADVFLVLNLREGALKNVISQCHALKVQQAQKDVQDEQDRKDADAKEAADKVKAAADKDRAARIEHFGHGPIPESAKVTLTGPSPGCADGSNIVLKVTKPTELLQHPPSWDKDKSLIHTPQRIFGTLSIGQQVSFQFCQFLQYDDASYINVSLQDGDPWGKQNHAIGGYIANSAVDYGSAKEWQAFADQQAAARKAAFQQKLATFTSFLTTLGPLPAGVRECFETACKVHIVSFKTTRDTVVIANSPQDTDPRNHATLPAGSHICTIEGSEIRDGYLHADCVNSLTFVPSQGKFDFYGGWVELKALAYDTDHPKHNVFGK